MQAHHEQLFEVIVLVLKRYRLIRIDWMLLFYRNAQITFSTFENIGFQFVKCWNPTLLFNEAINRISSRLPMFQFIVVFFLVCYAPQLSQIQYMNNVT